MIFPFRQVLRLEWCRAVNTGFGPIVALNSRRRSEWLDPMTPSISFINRATSVRSWNSKTRGAPSLLDDGSLTTVVARPRCARSAEPKRGCELAHRRHGQRLAADIDGPKECDVAGHDIANAAASSSSHCSRMK
jgi:hypothetical protein